MQSTIHPLADVKMPSTATGDIDHMEIETVREWEIRRSLRAGVQRHSDISPEYSGMAKC